MSTTRDIDPSDEETVKYRLEDLLPSEEEEITSNVGSTGGNKRRKRKIVGYPAVFILSIICVCLIACLCIFVGNIILISVFHLSKKSSSEKTKIYVATLKNDELTLKKLTNNAPGEESPRTSWTCYSTCEDCKDGGTREVMCESGMGSYHSSHGTCHYRNADSCNNLGCNGMGHTSCE